MHPILHHKFISSDSFNSRNGVFFQHLFCHPSHSVLRIQTIILYNEKVRIIGGLFVDKVSGSGFSRIRIRLTPKDRLRIRKTGLILVSIHIPGVIWTVRDLYLIHFAAFSRLRYFDFRKFRARFPTEYDFFILIHTKNMMKFKP